MLTKYKKISYAGETVSRDHIKVWNSQNIAKIWGFAISLFLFRFSK